MPCRTHFSASSGDRFIKDESIPHRYGPFVALAAMETGPATLLSYTNAGLNLLKKGQYERAATHFSNASKALKTGVHLNVSKIECHFPIPEDPIIASGILRRCPEVKFDNIKRSVEISPVLFSQPPKTLAQKRIKQAFDYLNATFALEEWLHAIQIQTGRYVSQIHHHAPLFPNGIDSAAKLHAEQDIADFFAENGIPVNDMFALSYDRDIGTKVPQRRFNPMPFPDLRPIGGTLIQEVTYQLSLMNTGQTATLGSNADLLVNVPGNSFPETVCIVTKNLNDSYEITATPGNTVKLVRARLTEDPVTHHTNHDIQNFGSQFSQVVAEPGDLIHLRYQAAKDMLRQFTVKIPVKQRPA